MQKLHQNYLLLVPMSLPLNLIHLQKVEYQPVIMGTGTSFMRGRDDDDILGTDLNGSSRGVIMRIPNEMKPRGKLGLRSVGSVGRKPKGGSLR